jgi:hypothetical protein
MKKFVVTVSLLIEADNAHAAEAVVCEAIDAGHPTLLDFDINDDTREVMVEIRQEQRAGYLADLTIRH